MTQTQVENLQTTERIMVAFLYCQGHESVAVFIDEAKNCCWEFEVTDDLEDDVMDFAMGRARISPQDYHNKFNKVRNEQRDAASVG